VKEPVDATVTSVHYYQIVRRHISQDSDRPSYNHCNERFQKRSYYVTKLQNLWSLLYFVTSAISVFLNMLEISRNIK
jgi:hypothetical protein